MPKIVDKKAKADRIADAAIRTLRKNGYAGTRMADIAQAAGIGKGTLYEYFKDKPDIVRHAFDTYFEAFARGMERTMAEHSRAVSKLLALLEFAMAHAREWEDHCTVVIDQMSADRSPAERAFLTSIYDEMKALIAGLVRKGQAEGSLNPSFSPEVLSELFVSIYDGIILHRLLQEKDMDIHALSETVLHLMQGGILSDTERSEQTKKG